MCVEVTQTLVNTKVELASALGRNESLEMQCRELQRILTADTTELTADIMEARKQRGQLEELNRELEMELVNTKVKYASSQQEQDDLRYQLEQQSRKVVLKAL